MNVTVAVPASVSLESLRAAVESLGARLVVRQAKAKAEREYKPLILRNKDGEEVREIYGVTVDKAIRKLMNERARLQNACGHDQFPRVWGEITTAEYVARCEELWGLKPTVTPAIVAKARAE